MRSQNDTINIPSLQPFDRLDLLLYHGCSAVACQDRSGFQVLARNCHETTIRAVRRNELLCWCLAFVNPLGFARLLNERERERNTVEFFIAVKKTRPCQRVHVPWCQLWTRTTTSTRTTSSRTRLLLLVYPWRHETRQLMLRLGKVGSVRMHSLSCSWWAR